ncbi:Nuclear pore complex protein Nup50 [Nymphon striatum]|nr:Nuclear pore complex protein Nup50 [Nymphon striatum]
MSKRGPTSQLNHDNWDVEDENIEEAGRFETASQEELKKRVIKKARRIKPSDTASPFAAFSGFKSTPSSKPAFSGYYFNSGSKKEGDSTTEASENESKSTSKQSLSGFSFSSQKCDTTTKEKDTNSTTKPDLSGFSFVMNKKGDESKENHGNGSTNIGFSFKTASNIGMSTNTSDSKENSDGSSDQSNSEAEYSDSYYESLKSLNDNFLSWIQRHLDKSKYCIFTPGFKDYEKYLSDLEQQYKIVKKSANPKSTSTSSTGSLGFSFTPSSAVSSASTEKSSDKAIFSFSENSKTSSTTATSLSGFSFADSAAKAAAVTNAPASTTSSEERKNDEEYSPPENEFKEVTEDESFYSQKCKLFYKKSGNFAEKGKGTLFLKKAEDKTQLIIRADTNLGNILLNTLLNKSMPTSRMGKNNVMIACVPNPPIGANDSSEPIPMLIRVKTGEDADKLLENIESSK